MSVQTARRSKPNGAPPRRRRPRRSLLRHVIWPVAKVILVVAVAGFVGTLIVGKIARPFQLCSAEGRDVSRMQSELATLKEENRALERQIGYLKTSRGIAEAARKLGYVKPGEITLIIPDEEPTIPAQR